MPRKTPPSPPQPLYRVLETLERLDGLGFHRAGDIVQAAELRPTSIVPLMAAQIIMPYLDPRVIAALPAYA